MGTSTITLEDARRAVASEARKRNFKIVEQIPGIIAELAKQKAVYVFNVGPTSWSRNLGSLGNFHVPACPEGAKVSEPLKIAGVVLERVATDMDKMSNRYEEGLQIAQDVLFIGRGYAPQLNREEWGMFISETAEPTPKQIRDAQARLRQTQAKLVSEADNLERNNKRSEIGEIHRQAAEALGLNKAWLPTEPVEAEACPACNKRIDPSSIICPECSAILDIEGAKKYFPEKFIAYQRANQPAPAAK